MTHHENISESQGDTAKMQPAQVTKEEAADLTGKSRSTIYRHIAQGKLTEVNGKIDVAELLRVYGEIRKNPSQSQSDVPMEQGENPELLRELLAEKDKRIEEVTKDRDHWRTLAEEQNVKLLTHQGNTSPQTSQVLLAMGMLAILVAVVFVALSAA